MSTRGGPGCDAPPHSPLAPFRRKWDPMPLSRAGESPTMPTSAQKIRTHQGPALFRQGFRPFFLGAALFAGLAVPAWLAALAGFDMALPSDLDPRGWHVHEMVFGYFPAVMTGFLLTAVPNWTGRLPVAGRGLAALAALWLAGRVAMAVSAGWAMGATIVDIAFLAAVATIIWTEVIAGRNWRNLPVCLLVTLIALANVGFHAERLFDLSPGASARVALAVIATLIALIGGRVTPSFTRNWLAQRGTAAVPAPFGILDKLALIAGIAAALAWIGWPYHPVTGALFVLAFLCHSVRLARWQGGRTAAEPLVTILHLGYAWLPAWFALQALSILAPDTIDPSSALHALTAGAVGTMTLAVMTRAVLGHTGRPLTAGPATATIYGLVIAGAVLRIGAAWLPADFIAVMTAGGGLWAAAFLLFALTYGPMMTRNPGKPAP